MRVAGLLLDIKPTITFGVPDDNSSSKSSTNELALFDDDDLSVATHSDVSLYSFCSTSTPKSLDQSISACQQKSKSLAHGNNTALPGEAGSE